MGAERAYAVTCSSGHDAVLLLANAPYSLLFERGLSRLVSGDTRDAVLDAYTAFEMFCGEYPVRLRHAAAPAPLVMIRDEMKAVTKTSDRALAVTYAGFALVTQRPVRKLPAIVETRNKAVHQGIRPSHDEALKLCRCVSSEIEALNEAVTPYQHLAYLMAERENLIAECTERFGDRPVFEQSFSSVLDSFGWLPGLHGVIGRPSVDDQIAALHSGPIASWWVQPVKPIEVAPPEDDGGSPVPGQVDR